LIIPDTYSQRSNQHLNNIFKRVYISLLAFIYLHASNKNSATLGRVNSNDDNYLPEHFLA